ncbi:MAG TPA: protein kinase [Solirubrobacteraceae bacterium]|nr:protein kinase [Solirubrobacteraceae bacterium]
MVGRLDVEAAFEAAGYRIEAVIGRGGVGTVYRAVQLTLQRDVALKLLTAEQSADTSFRQDFLDESILAASLDHPHIVPVYDAGEVEQILYLAMRYVPGSDLHGMIRREGRLSPHASVLVLEQVAGALDTAHGAGLIHRDVKPSNVLIAGGQGAEAPLHAWLGDFGLSRRVSDPSERTTERPLGTVHYVAPEQIRGETVDHRADIYSLGCLLFECLTGSVPFPQASVPAVLYAHLEAPIPTVSDLNLGLPPAMDDVIAWALAKNPDQRPQHAGELARAAARALGGGEAHRPAVNGSGANGSAAPARVRGTRRARANRPIVGRLLESEDLVSLLDDATAGMGGVATLSGEAGIGKTTLARQLSTLAEQRGIPALWGVGASAEAARPYWHWIQVVRAIAARREGPEVFQALGPVGAWLDAIVPDLELGGGSAPSPPPSQIGAEEGRFHLYDALLRLLEIAAERSGLLIVLDDLHFADEASLLALSYISRAVGDKRILIVCTHRDLELEESRREAAPFSELVRPTLGIVLKGLGAADVGRMIESRRDVPPPEALVDRIHQLTGGNPLFVSELLSLIEAEQDIDDSAVAAGAVPLPAGVRDAITARLAMLSPEGREMLSVASVIGQQFRAGTLATAAGTPPVELLELLDEAVRLRLVRPTTQYADGYGFHHGLIQATLYDAIPRARRLAWHDAVARALEQDPAAAAGEGLSEIAHHYLEAAPAGHPQRAIEYARRAGDRAMETFAYDQAVAMYRGALGVSGLTETQRGELLQALGEAQMRVGDTDAARQTLLRAADAARVRNDPVAFAHAALGCAIWGLTNGTDEQLVGLAQEAVARLEHVDAPGLMARVEGLLAAAIYWSDEVERRERLAGDALRLARGEDERRHDRESGETLGYVLGRYLLARWGPQSAIRDVPISDEVVALAQRIGDFELELLIRNWRISVLMELGRFAAVDQEIARVEQMAGELRQPRAMVFLPLHYALRAGTMGRFDEAEGLNSHSSEIGRQLRGSTSDLAGSAQLLMLRFLQGRLPELEPPLRTLAASRPEMVGYACALAAMLSQAGRPAEAQAELERLTASGLDGFPKDCTHLLMLALVGDVAAELQDAERARLIYSWLEPYSGRWVVSAGASALWPVDRSLGRLATASGSIDVALNHIASARDQSERAGALPATTLAMLDEARALMARGDAEDHDRIRRLARQVLEQAQQIGMGWVVDAAVALDVELGFGIEAEA